MRRAVATPPRDEADLLARAEALAGRTLGYIAEERTVAVPPDLRRAKGWPGQLLEIALGATASSRAQPDFPHLGIEMKSVPVDERGRPREGTYVCTAPLSLNGLGSWEDSWLRRKLRRVLWIPLLGEGPPGQRLVGSPVMWSPDEDEWQLLRDDWESFAASVALGELWQMDGRRGKVLQLRPKGANRRSTTWTLDDGAQWVQAMPRGFYLRPAFTGAILARALILPQRRVED